MATAHRTPRTISPRRAFTLLEMMLVVVIIGLLMGVAVWNIVGTGDKARTQTTIATMRQTESFLKAYNLDTGNFPPALTNLMPQYTEKVPKDAWKRDLIYFVNPPGSTHPYELYSTGKSGEQGNPDNINIHKLDEPAPNQ